MAWGNNSFSLGDAGYIAPIMQQMNRTGDIMQYGAQLQRQDTLDAERRQQNAFERQIQGLKMEELKQERAEMMQHKNAFAQAMTVTDPGKDPEGFARLYVASGGNPEIAWKMIESSNKGLVKIGENESLYDPRQGKAVAQGTGSGLTGEAKNLKTILGRDPTMEDYLGLKRAGATTITPYQQESLEIRRESNKQREGQQQEALDLRKEISQQNMEFKKEQKDEKKQVEMARDAGLQRTINYGLNELDATIDKILGSKGLENISGYTGLIPITVRQSTRDAQALLEKVKANLIVNTLQDLRMSSTNGSSGFGQLTEKENLTLQNKLAAIKEATSHEQLVAELKGLKAWTQSLRSNMKQTFADTWEGRAPKSAAGGTVKFKSSDEVKAAFAGKQISQEEAVKILKEQFGME